MNDQSGQTGSSPWQSHGDFERIYMVKRHPWKKEVIKAGQRVKNPYKSARGPLPSYRTLKEALQRKGLQMPHTEDLGPTPLHEAML